MAVNYKLFIFVQSQNQNKKIVANSLRLIKQCPVCNSRFQADNAKVVEDSQEGALIHFSCPVCFSSLLVNIFELPFGAIASAMLTDLEADEVLKFRNGEEVTADDVLEVYQSLEHRACPERSEGIPGKQ